jgi:wyosine [tRNA(Phe)-imidazoG37] synthetase (radical SAM superfamily)
MTFSLSLSLSLCFVHFLHVSDEHRFIEPQSFSSFVVAPSSQLSKLDSLITSPTMTSLSVVSNTQSSLQSQTQNQKKRKFEGIFKTFNQIHSNKRRRKFQCHQITQNRQHFPTEGMSDYTTLPVTEDVENEEIDKESML